MGIRVGVGMSFCLCGWMDGGGSVWADGWFYIVLINAEYIGYSCSLWFHFVCVNRPLKKQEEYLIKNSMIKLTLWNKWFFFWTVSFKLVNWTCPNDLDQFVNSSLATLSQLFFFKECFWNFYPIWSHSKEDYMNLLRIKSDPIG